jgi:hypothetical protein
MSGVWLFEGSPFHIVAYSRILSGGAMNPWRLDVQGMSSRVQISSPTNNAVCTTFQVTQNLPMVPGKQTNS